MRPDPAMIESARRAQRMTMREASNVIYGTESAWKAWESGQRPMHAGLWELFKVKTLDREVLRALGLKPSGDAPAPSATPPGTSAPAADSTASPDTP
jgi:putative transcriptional regulator